MNTMLVSILLSSIISPPAELPILVDGALSHPSRLMVKSENSAAIRSRYTVLREMPQIGWMVVETPAGQLQLSRRNIQSLPGVQAVELDRAARLAYEPNDEYWPSQWHMRTIKANLAWDLSFGLPVVVAVIDTGVEVSHPDLQGNVWVNEDEIPGNSVDDDSNGYVDDVNGYDFAYNDPIADDVYGHGTACAGLVGAVQDNSIGVTGVAPKAKIMALKSSIDAGYLYDSANVPAYLYAADNGAKVMSMSFYSDRVSQAERDAIDYAWNKGLLPVAAAGNAASSYPFYPSGYENTMAVAATNESNGKAGFSNYGSWVDVAAPGVSLTTIHTGGSYGGFGGTSGATPHVAGLAALLIGSRPGVTNADARRAIEDSAALLADGNYGEFSNYGLIDAQAAMVAILGSPAPPKPNIVRYMTPVAVKQAYLGNQVATLSRIYGRGFQSGPLKISIGSLPLKIRGRARDWVDVLLPAKPGPITIEANGNTTVIQRPAAEGLTNPLIEGSSPDAQVIGGFYKALLADGDPLRCTRHGDGYVSLQATFRKVRKGSTNVEMVYVRRYAGTGVGVERVYLYDWSSASYPYGNFIELYGGAVPTSYTTTRIAVPDPDRFIDPEGTMYLLIQTSNDLPGGAELQLDQMHLVQRS